MSNQDENAGTQAAFQDAQASNPLVHSFVEGLRTLEAAGDAESLLALFSDDCTIKSIRVEKPLQGKDGAARFWHEYRDTFREVTSRFTHILETGEGAALEWVSTGTLKTGHALAYSGVTILTFAEGNSISGFMSYFDSHPFTAHVHLS